MENYDLWDKEKQKQLKEEAFNKKYRKSPESAEEAEYLQFLDESS